MPLLRSRASVKEGHFKSYQGVLQFITDIELLGPQASLCKRVLGGIPAGGTCALHRFALTVPVAACHRKRRQRPQWACQLPRLAGVSSPGGRVHVSAEADQVGQHCDCVEVAQLRESRQAERVQVVSAEQAQVGVVRVNDATARVVQQVPLEHALDEQRVLVPVRARAPAGRGQRPERGLHLGLCSRIYEGFIERSLLLLEERAQARQRVTADGRLVSLAGTGQLATASKAGPAASSVRSISRSPCAKEGNQASNGEGGR